MRATKDDGGGWRSWQFLQVQQAQHRALVSAPKLGLHLKAQCPCGALVRFALRFEHTLHTQHAWLVGFNQVGALHPQGLGGGLMDLKSVLRQLLRSGADGGFHFRTVAAEPYPIPTDGPVGELLRISHRDAWRPAHYHVIVEAPGYRSLITEVFDAADPWLDKDAVFGVRASLVCDFKSESDPANATRLGLPAQYLAIELPIRLARED